MEVEVILSPQEVKLHDLQGKTVVVIDVFRFTTTILAALEAGAEAFYPVATVEEAWDLKKADPQLLLAGERKALPIPGFDFGNSPLEHVGKSHLGKKLVCTTTNGTQAIQAAQRGKRVILASLRSAEAVAKYLAQTAEPVVFVPAGINGKFSLEDTWCAGLILNYLPQALLGDGAQVARSIYTTLAKEELKASAHGQRLQDLKLFADLDYCLTCNVSSGVINWDPQTGWGALAQ